MAKTMSMIYPPFTMLFNKLSVDYTQIKHTQAFSFYRELTAAYLSGARPIDWIIFEIPQAYCYNLMELRILAKDTRGQVNTPATPRIELFQVQRTRQVITIPVPIYLITNGKPTTLVNHAQFYNMNFNWTFLPLDLIKIKINWTNLLNNNHNTARPDMGLHVMTVGNFILRKKAYRKANSAMGY